MAAPLQTSELETIAAEVCQGAIGAAEKYDHANVTTWNSDIINNMLKSLIDKTSGPEGKSPAFKYIVNSTIIQHLSSPAEGSVAGRRGMHSAIGAYWNNEKDGTWSYKWNKAEEKGMDVVITVTWIGL